MYHKQKARSQFVLGPLRGWHAFLAFPILREGGFGLLGDFVLLCGPSLKEDAPSVKETRLSICAFMIEFAGKINSILGFSVKLGLRFFSEPEAGAAVSQEHSLGHERVTY